MKRIWVSAIVALAAVGLLAIAVSGQEGVSGGMFQPFSIQVTHEEPITVVATTTTPAGDVVTVTTPITIGVDLRINVDGPGIASVESDGPTASDVQIFIATPQPAPAGADGFVDSSGRIYTTDAPDGVTLGQIQSKQGIVGSEFFGQITNDTDTAISTVFVTVQVLDEDGVMLAVENGMASLSEVAPGQSSPFQVLSQVPYDDVASYIVQVNP